MLPQIFTFSQIIFSMIPLPLQSSQAEIIAKDMGKAFMKDDIVTTPSGTVCTPEGNFSIAMLDIPHLSVDDITSVTPTSQGGIWTAMVKIASLFDEIAHQAGRINFRSPHAMVTNAMVKDESRTFYLCAIRDDLDLPIHDYGYRLITTESSVTADDIVGVAMLSFDEVEDPHVADGVIIAVDTPYRRFGIGRTLHRACEDLARNFSCTTIQGWTFCPPSPDAEFTQTASAFTSALGYRPALQEWVLSYPLESRIAPCDLPKGYRIEIWEDSIPTVYLDAIATIRTAASSDVPMGDLDHEPILWDWRRIQRNNQRDLLSSQIISVMICDQNGSPAGYSEVRRDRTYPAQVNQYLSLILPQYRGRGLAKLLKTALMTHLLDSWPDSQILSTENAVDNTAMIRVNKHFGFNITGQSLFWTRSL